MHETGKPETQLKPAPLGKGLAESPKGLRIPTPPESAAREEVCGRRFRVSVARKAYFPSSICLMACSAATRPEVIAKDEAEPSQRRSYEES